MKKFKKARWMANLQISIKNRGEKNQKKGATYPSAGDRS
jgi:hypothetical protein